MKSKKKYVNTGFIEFVEDTVQTRIAEMPWMADREFLLAKSIEEVEEYIDKAIESERCTLDLETTGLNTRVKKVDKKIVPVMKIVGFGLCYDSSCAMYIPINHIEGAELNLPEDLVLKEIKRLCLNSITIYHNAKFDLTFLKNYGITLNDHTQFEDTLIMAYLHDSGRKVNNLKSLSLKLLDQEMLKFNDIAKEGHFDLVSPSVGYIYGASDAMCTMDLFNFFIEQGIIKAQQMIYNLEKRVVFVVMDMEANLIKINVPYLQGLKDKVELRVKKIEQEIYDLVGHPFDLGSSQKLGKILFDNLKYKYPGDGLTKSGQYSTDSKTLSKIADLYPIVKKITVYRGLKKILSTYINNLLNNYDEDGCVKLSFKPTGTDTGRLSSPGGNGIDIDGYAGVNVQSIPKIPGEENPDIDIREAFMAREGMTLAAIDYANEEMRVATNISNETAWIKSILKGIDFHTATGAIISGKDPKDVLKAERKIGKCVAKGTLIASNRGWVPIEELNERDLVLTHKGMFKRVLKIWDMGEKPGVKIVTGLGQKITCGLNHRFLGINDKWIRAEDLSIGLFIRTIPSKYMNSNLYVDKVKEIFTFRWDTYIKDIEEVDNIHLMDLTIEEDHTYVAQGLITHNTVNFLALYLGGPKTLAGSAKVTITEAKKILATFFAGVPKLKKWIDCVIAEARKAKVVKTVFGRVRPLEKYYNSGDKGLMAHADRCAVNTKIQGCISQEEKCLTTGGYLPIIKIKGLKESGKDLKVWTGISWEDFEVLDRGEAQLATIELKNGMVLHCDTRHEVLTVDDEGYEYKHFDDLTEETKICVSRPRLLEFGSYPERWLFKGNAQELIIGTIERWDFIAYFLGCVVGDGVVTFEQYRIKLCFGKEKVANLYPVLKEKLNGFGINVSEPKISKGSKGLSYIVSIYSIAMIKLFEKMGYKFHNAHDKRVPQQIMESPISMRVSFLKGYFYTDECKKEINKYSFHTPNKELLRDLQLLAWTLGCPSNIYDCNDGSYMFNWLNYRLFAELLGLPYEEAKRRHNSDIMVLPDFLRNYILHSLGKNYVKSEKNRAYVSKVRTGKSVSLPGIVSFLESYDCEMPEIYYYSNLKKKTVLEKRETTYTLSVHSPLHRFDSAGIISKNTSADIMKLVMARMNTWLTQYNLHDDIKILITMHDELVFEVLTEKFKLYIPEICKIMQLDHIIKDKLKWTIPLEVDVQYGDTWRVKNDFFEDFPELKKRLDEPMIDLLSLQERGPEDKGSKKVDSSVKKFEIEEVNTENASEKGPEKQPDIEKDVSETQDVDNTPQDGVFEKIEVEEEKKEKTEKNEIISEVKNEIGGSGSDQYFIYTLKVLTKTSLRWLNNILLFLIETPSDNDDHLKKILKIRDKKGNSLLVSEFKVDVKSFLVLARYFDL